MAIVSLVKVAILGESYRKRHVLAALQELGFLHLISHTEADGGMPSFRATRAYEAYLYLKTSPAKRRQVQDDPDFHFEDFVETALQIRDQVLNLEEEKLLLHRRLAALKPWGDFDYRDLKNCGKLSLWFYSVPLGEMPEVKETDLIWESVYQDNRFAYVAVVSEDEPQEMPVPRIHTGSKSLSWLQNRLDNVEEELEDLHWQRVGLTGRLTLLAKKLAFAADQAGLDKAETETYDDAKLFAIEAWAPEASIDKIEEFTRSQGLLLDVTPAGKDDRPPTLLDNPSAWSAGQDLVGFYTTPAYLLWDPSKLVFAFFIIFFSMIVADAGYGLLLLAGVLSCHRPVRHSSAPLYRLMLFLAVGTVGYGALCGSYFGFSPPAGSFLEDLKVIDLQNQDFMMKFSVIVGVVHLSTALASQIIFSAQRRFPLQNLGWLLVLLGGLLLWLTPVSLAGADAARLVCWTIMAAGALLILCFSSDRPWRNGSVKDRLLRFGEGLFALTGISKIFGDVLSYLRLFALGLASAQLAVTFNVLAQDSMESIAGGGTLVAILILCLGHGLNLLLALMSGVVHGLRLNYIEFFNWGLAEEGTPFKPFAKRRISVWNQL